MKKIYIILMITIGLQACKQEFIELEPLVNESEANAYKTEEDAMLALASVYNCLAVQVWEYVPIQSDIRSDDAFCGGTAGGTDMAQWQEMEEYAPTSENAAVLALWNRCYSGNYRANQFLAKTDGISWSSEATKNRMVAETKFLRAYFYWDLVRHYGWAPIILSILPVPDYQTIPQEEPIVVYKQIVTDLLEAVKYCPTNIPQTELGRVSKYAAEALLVRIYLYYEGFAKPVLNITSDLTNNDGSVVINKAWAQAAIKDIVGSTKYDLMPTYAELFDWSNDQNTKENIFSFQYSEKSQSGDWSGWTVTGNFASVFYGPRSPVPDTTVSAGWSYATPTWTLVNEFQPGDPRADVSLYNANKELTSYTIGFQNTGYFNKKFMGIKAYESTANPAQNFPINYPDIRYADVLLMGAELFLEDDPTLAKTYFDKVRGRAMPSNIPSSINLDSIYHERRVELSGEGHRYWDLLRRGLTYAEQHINASFQNIPDSADFPNDFDARNFNPNTYGMLPIPASEMRLNKNLKQHIPAYQ
jgi:hypothetical protein